MTINRVVSLFGSLLVVAINAAKEDANHIASTQSGFVSGSKMLATQDREFLAFRGIPYAQPPTGKLRFQDPVPVSPWEGVFDGTKEGPSCLQWDDRSNDFKGDEDCLRLNVYTHDVSPNSTLRPVMVFIHGGNWVIGSGNGETDIYGPNNFLDRDVVLVTINYRLSALGFLSTEDHLAPGNYGLLDQNMALQWIKKNIHSFGGDNGSITIFGHSSGAGSVHLHLLSQRSRGLFHRAIAQSGTALCPWSTMNYVGIYTNRLAEHLKCTTVSSAELLECLRKKDAKDIIKFRKTIEIIDGTPIPIAFGPRVDVERKLPFLAAKPADVIRSRQFNDVPFITGVTANEAAFVVARLASKGMDKIHDFGANPSVFLQYAMGMEFETHLRNQSLEVFHNYFNDTKNMDLNRMEQMLSDGLFFNCITQTIDLHVRHGAAPTYTYLYNHQGLFTFPMLFSEDLPVEFGVSHGDEIFIEFAIPFLPPLFLPNDMDTEETLMDLWTTFALNGIPEKVNSTVQWLPVDKNQMQYITIKDGEISLVKETFPFSSRLNKWTSLIPQ